MKSEMSAHWTNSDSYYILPPGALQATRNSSAFISLYPITGRHGMQHSTSDVEMVFLGPLQSDYGILPDQRVYQRMPGGAALYAAVGASIWTPTGLGIVSHIGDNYPKEWLATILRNAIAVGGILHTPGKISMEVFASFPTWDELIESDPVQEFARRNIACPPRIAGCRPSASGEPDPSFLSFLVTQPEELAASIRQTRYAYLGPDDLAVQKSIANILRKFGVGKILLELPERTLTPPHMANVRSLLRGIDFCFCSEAGLRRVMDRRAEKLQTLMEDLAAFGPQIVLCQRNREGFAMYDSDAKCHLFIPSYTATVQNPIGIGHAFCGGFFSWWKQTYNLLEAGLRGSISSSLAADGLGAFHSWDCHPLLAEARLDALRRSLST
jgi:hypothetical protein